MYSYLHTPLSTPCLSPCTFIHLSYQANEKPCHRAINSRPRNLRIALKKYFDFTEIVNNYGLKRGTICQIVGFISQFSLKLYIQFWKYFHSMVLGSVDRGYCGKNRVLEFLAKIWLGCLSVFKNVFE